MILGLVGLLRSPTVTTPRSQPAPVNNLAAQPDPSESVTLSQRTAPKPKLQVALEALVASMAPFAGIAMALTSKAPQPDLASQPEVQLQRPLLFVPGFQSKEGCFDDLTAKLTANGANGGQVYYVDGHDIFLDKDCRQRATTVSSEARVFVAALGANRDAPPVVASVLNGALADISQICGQKVDVTGYSMGGLATRLYLDRGGQQIGKFMMVGTPNHGSPLADMGMGLLDKENEGKSVGWLLNGGPKPLNQADRSALNWLTPDHKPDRNPGLEGLNARWERQRAAVEDVEVVGSANLTTLRFDFKPGRGDGTVPAESLAPSPDTPVIFLDDKVNSRHGKLLQSASLYQEMTRFFAWQPSTQ